MVRVGNAIKGEPMMDFFEAINKSWQVICTCCFVIGWLATMNMKVRSNERAQKKLFEKIETIEKANIAANARIEEESRKTDRLQQFMMDQVRDISEKFGSLTARLDRLIDNRK